MISDKRQRGVTLPEDGCRCRDTASDPLPLARTATRRGVVRGAMLGTTALGVLGVAAACGDEGAGKGGETAQAVTIAKADVPPVGGAPFKGSDGTFYLVHNADGLLALSRTCTHMGCVVPWNAGEGCFHCPCHNSKFDRNGVRFAGPAKRPLDLVKLTVRRNGDVMVSPDERSDRSDYNPEQAEPYPV